MYGNKSSRWKGVQLFSEKNGNLYRPSPMLSSSSYEYRVIRGWVWIFRTGGGVRISFTRGRSPLSLVIITFAYQWEEAPSLWCHQGLEKFKKHQQKNRKHTFTKYLKALHDCFFYSHAYEVSFTRKIITRPYSDIVGFKNLDMAC